MVWQIIVILFIKHFLAFKDVRYFYAVTKTRNSVESVPRGNFAIKWIVRDGI